MLPALDEIAVRHFGVLTTAQALATGHDHEEIRTALRTRHRVRTRRGVHCTAARAAAAAGRTSGHLLDDALHRGLTDPEQLREAVGGARHREGSASAARAVGLADGRAESPLESAGRVRIVTSGLPTPELQVELGDDGFVGRVDGWYDEVALARSAEPDAGDAGHPVRGPAGVPRRPHPTVGRLRTISYRAAWGPTSWQDAG